mmetsp:Transcript_70466/g.199851  ORF Transcript_70466/g.199851 Transcript_70466/m.199851 type:complete len:213 (+) Transcript_70466:297-935(+)
MSGREPRAPRRVARVHRQEDRAALARRGPEQGGRLRRPHGRGMVPPAVRQARHRPDAAPPRGEEAGQTDFAQLHCLGQRHDPAEEARALHRGRPHAAHGRGQAQARLRLLLQRRLPEAHGPGPEAVQHQGHREPQQGLRGPSHGHAQALRQGDARAVRGPQREEAAGVPPVALEGSGGRLRPRRQLVQLHARLQRVLLHGLLGAPQAPDVHG